MKLEINEDGCIEISEFFNPIILKDENGDKTIVCLRNGGIEIKRPGSKNFIYLTKKLGWGN